MSYTEREQSAYSGHPLELYRFSLGDTQWLYTSADHEVTFVDALYQPCYIKRGGFTQGGDVRKATMEIEVAAASPIALPFRGGWLSGSMVVTVYRHHYQDADFSVLWKGRVTGCKWSGSVATLTTESVFTLFQRAGLRRVYQVGCPHVLYGDACRVDADLYMVAGAVVAVTGNTVEVSGAGGYGDGYFVGGKLRSGDDLRMIVAHSGATVTLIDAIEGLAIGDAVSVWPGCDRTTATCSATFNNIDNFGGLPFLPADNPFSGDALV